MKEKKYERREEDRREGFLLLHVPIEVLSWIQDPIQFVWDEPAFVVWEEQPLSVEEERRRSLKAEVLS